MSTFELRPTGSFSLAELAGFGFGPRQAPFFDGTFRLAFALDDTWEPVGVEVGQAGEVVTGRIHGGADPDRIRRQVARMLSLDHDGRPYDAIGEQDPVIGRLQGLRPGLRPPLFASPYEAAAWSVLSARRPARQMAEVRRRLSEAHGTPFDLAGRCEAAFPDPEALLGVDAVPGLDRAKVGRLHGVARAALDGRLGIDRLQALGPEEAGAELRTIKGIGPFYASLIVIRACGWADVPTPAEPRLARAVGDLYGLGRPATDDDLAALGERWRPRRTWAAVLIRATHAGPSTP